MEVLTKRRRNDGVKTWLLGSVHFIKCEHSTNRPSTLSQIREGWRAPGWRSQLLPPFLVVYELLEFGVGGHTW